MGGGILGWAVLPGVNTRGLLPYDFGNQSYSHGCRPPGEETAGAIAIESKMKTLNRSMYRKQFARRLAERGMHVVARRWPQ